MKSARNAAKRTTTARNTFSGRLSFKTGLFTSGAYSKNSKRIEENLDALTIAKLKKYYRLRKHLLERDATAPHGTDASAERQESRTMPKRERLTQKQPLEFSADQIAAAVRALSEPGMLETYAAQGRTRVDQSWGYAADAETEFAPYRKLD